MRLFLELRGKTQTLSSKYHNRLPILLSLLLVLFSKLAIAQERPKDDRSELPPLPRLVLLPQANLTLGTGIFFATELGGALALRFGPIAFGLHAAVANSIGNGMSGCEGARFCVEDRSRFGAHSEYHFRSGHSVEPWVGIDLELAMAHGSPWDLHRPETRWGGFITAKGGIDFVGRWAHGMTGVGIFAATPWGGVSDASGLGLMLGLRAPMGFF